MKKVISSNLAGKILLGSFSLMLILHILIISQIIPANIIWGGQIKDDQSSLVSLEIVAISVTLVFMAIVAAKMRLMKMDQSKKVVDLGIWIVFIYLTLNALGNFASGISAETLFFGPLTIVMAFCAFRLAIEEKGRKKNEGV